ncbi:hypothetical protein LOD99_13817 [Oopsacas minuta]|uniref:CARD domain-containing protein n=1 Tax=Oopsacas minuta TaxID=111878 RepID=A0AAV7KJI4_9METZ|nr:hypothetical protein LOD99_13817 [Oopsacas minuta]
MGCNTESYKNFRTYELFIVNKLDFTKISHGLVNAGVMKEDEREKIGNIYSTKKQNIELVKHLEKERRDFEPFLETLQSDSSCIQHRELAKTIIARKNSKPDCQVDNFGSSGSDRRFLIGKPNPFQPIEVSQTRQIQILSGFVSWLFFFFMITLAILTMPVKIGYSCIKFILVT